MRADRRVALILLGAALIAAAGGALWFARYAPRVQRDPALVYRDPATLEQLLQRANDAERAGDRGTAATCRGGAAPVDRDVLRSGGLDAAVHAL